MMCAPTLYDVGKFPKDGTYRANARLSGLAHLKCRGGWEDTFLPPARARRALKVRGLGDGQSLLVRANKRAALKPVPDGTYIYGVSPKGALYIDIQRAYGTHGALMKYRPVQAAGWVTVVNHRIVCMDNISGHYLPTEEQLLQTAVDLREAGLVDPQVGLLGWENSVRQRSWLLGVEEFAPGAMHSLEQTDWPDGVVVLSKTSLGSLQLVPYAAALVCKNLLGVVTGRGRAPGWWLRAALAGYGVGEEHAAFLQEVDSRPTRPWSRTPVMVQLPADQVRGR